MTVLPGRLGLDGAELPHVDRHAFLALRYGRLEVEEGCLRFVSDAETRIIPYQRLSCIILEPGTSVTHDALRLLARHGVGLIATGLDGVKCYTAPPLLSDSSELARRQARAWADPELRLAVACRQYAMRFGEMPAARDLNELRGLEGARIREAYRHFSQANGISWDVPRSVERGTGDANTALNYAADAVYAAAAFAVYVTATIPQLGFVHEDSGRAFVLDVADLHRTSPDHFSGIQGAGSITTARPRRRSSGWVRQEFMQHFKRRSIVARHDRANHGAVHMRWALVALSSKPRRFSGFLHSAAMEIAPGVFLAADFNRAAFERIWHVLADWHAVWPEGWIVAVIPAEKPHHPPEIRALGVPARTLVEQDGIHLLLIEKGSGELALDLEGSSD